MSPARERERDEPPPREEVVQRVMVTHAAGTNYERILIFVERVGVPAAVLFYVLYKIDYALQLNTQALIDLRLVIQQLIAK